MIAELRDSLESTIVIVTHELASIFTVGDNSVFLDPDTKTMLTTGNPSELREGSPDERVRNFLQRGELVLLALADEGDLTDLSVHHIDLIVVPGLDDPIPHTQSALRPLDLDLRFAARVGRVQELAQTVVQTTLEPGGAIPVA